jgi:hypothetical protein
MPVKAPLLKALSLATSNRELEVGAHVWLKHRHDRRAAAAPEHS